MMLYFPKIPKLLQFMIDIRLAKSTMFENNRLTIEDQNNTTENFYNLLLKEFSHISRTNI